MASGQMIGRPPGDDEHFALRRMLEVTGPVAILRNGPLRQAVLALLTDRDEMAVNLARADEESDRLREHAVVLAATAEQVERERWQKQCAGKRHEGCHYVATCGSLCNKCGQWA